MNNKKTIALVVESKLCNSCGACFAACPAGAIAFRETVGGHLFPVIDEKKCVFCGRCYTACPGKGLEQPASEKLPQDPFAGGIRQAFVGRANDVVIFKNSQSGGVVTALIAHMLTRGEITGAVATVMKKGWPPRGMPVVVSSPEGLPETQKSKYLPIPLLKEIPSVLKQEGFFAFVGLPCHMHGLHNLFSLWPDLNRRIAVKIGLICDRVLSLAVMDYFSKLASFDSLSFLTFRDKQRPSYPGNVVVESDDGRTCILDASVRMTAKDFFTPARCRLCFDKLNALSDIVVGDPHGISGVNRTEGESLVFLRTEAGESFFSRAMEENVVVARKIEVREAVGGQGIENKRQEWNAYFTLWKGAGRQTPYYPESVIQSSRKAPEKIMQKNRANIKLALNLDGFATRDDLVEAAVSWARKKKMSGCIAFPFRLLRRTAGQIKRKVKKLLGGL